MSATQTQSSFELQTIEETFHFDSKATTKQHPASPPLPLASHSASEQRLGTATPEEEALDVGAQPVDGAHEFDSLPPADGGKQAWLFLTACFLVEALIWGEY